MESLNSNAAYLSESLQPLPYTPFAALMARKTNNESAAVRDTRPTEPVKIGVLGKSYVKEVSYCFKSINSENMPSDSKIDGFYSANHY